MEGRRRRLACVVLLLLFASVSTIFGQQSLAEGEAVFDRACAGCHGPGGTGGRGPSLRRALRHGTQASEIQSVIVNGIPGTGMPKFDLDQDELKALVPFVQSLSHTQGDSDKQDHGGDPAEGRRVYERSGCRNCHKIDAEGSAFGPNLTRIGSSRSYVYLKQAITDPSSDIPEEYQAVTVVAADGKVFRGLRVNEDSFTLQLRLPDQSFVSFDKMKLQKQTTETHSAMPPYRLQEGELKNLLAYLGSLAGEAPTQVRPKEEKR